MLSRKCLSSIDVVFEYFIENKTRLMRMHDGMIVQHEGFLAVHLGNAISLSSKLQ